MRRVRMSRKLKRPFRKTRPSSAIIIAALHLLLCHIALGKPTQTLVLPERKPDIETVEEVLRNQVSLPAPAKETSEQRARRFEANANDPLAQLGLSALYE